MLTPPRSGKVDSLPITVSPQHSLKSSSTPSEGRGHKKAASIEAVDGELLNAAIVPDKYIAPGKESGILTLPAAEAGATKAVLETEASQVVVQSDVNKQKEFGVVNDGSQERKDNEKSRAKDDNTRSETVAEVILSVQGDGDVGLGSEMKDREEEHVLQATGGIEPDPQLQREDQEGTDSVDGGGGDGNNTGSKGSDGSDSSVQSNLIKKMEETQKANMVTQEQVQRLTQLLGVLQTTPTEIPSDQTPVPSIDETTPKGVGSQYNALEVGPVGDAIAQVALIVPVDDEGIMVEEVYQPCNSAQVDDSDIVVVGEIVTGNADFGGLIGTPNTPSNHTHTTVTADASHEQDQQPMEAAILEERSDAVLDELSPIVDTPPLIRGQHSQKRPKFQLAASFKQ